ncbi:hypothetical protein HHL25_11065 [Rhizobium sp. S-51]|uniref:Uncharacterized protein n=1 Tax=Rhizobium terricola TaxID=2728849 RepID=A0A7Y0AWB9_9HYPH|nr:hypothetical protein [Rhizobium terricola]NML74664.1 hypothetical protein [Rhizobium terricola]
MQTTIFCDGAPLSLSARADLLSDRLAELPRASEHHIWEAFNVLDSLAACRQNPVDRRLFRAKMDALAYFDALLFLVGRCNPPLELADLSFSAEVWFCRLGARSPDPAAGGASTHRDRNAAVLLALIAASRHAAGSR